LSLATQVDEITALIAESEAEYRRSPRSALERATRAAKLAQDLPDDPSIQLLRARAQLARGSALHVLSEQRRAREAIDRALKIFQKLGDTAGESDALHKLAALHYDAGKTRSALQLAVRSLRLREQLGDALRIADTLIVLAHIHHGQGEQGKALRYALRSLTHAKAHTVPDNPSAVQRQAVALQTLGSIYTSSDMLADALEHYTQSLECYAIAGDAAGEAGCWYRLAQLQSATDQDQLALQSCSHALSTYEAIGEKLGAVLVLNHISTIHLAALSSRAESDAKLETGAAFEACKNALDGASEIVPGAASIDATINMGELEYLRGNTEAALDHLASAHEMARAMENLPAMVRVTALLRDVHAHCSRYKDALHFARESARLSIDLVRRENANEIRIYKAKAELAQARAEADRLKHESERLRLDVAHQSKELSSLALHLVERKSFLSELRRALVTAANTSDMRMTEDDRASTRYASYDGHGGKTKRARESPTGDRPKIAELQRSLRSAIKKINEKIESDGDFKLLDDQLTIVQDVFLQLLAKKYPQLTSTERKICVLLRLDLSSKDIAGILHVSPLTISTHRRRIRQKLDLKRGNLISFLLGLEDSE
jgi:DNA-binding CsgD family transcriptional regulator